jgi:hypothetical protein
MYYHHRPPSRLFWFFLGGVTATWFITSRPDRERADWRAKCLAWKARYSLEGPQSQNQGQMHTQEDARERALEEEKYMWWKLRSEREADRRKAYEFQNGMDQVKDTVIFVWLDYYVLLTMYYRPLKPLRKGWSL